MTFLKDKNDDINFQKASTTIDGCVKIYSSRVESVIMDTGKLLSGLSSPAEAPLKKNNGTGEQVQDDETVFCTNDEKHFLGKTKKKIGSSVDTLAKSFDSINIKSFDLDTSLDPLFKKISAEFDEGGYKGLLLNRLEIGQDGAFLLDPNMKLFTFGTKESHHHAHFNQKLDSSYLDEFDKLVSEKKDPFPISSSFKSFYIDFQPYFPEDFINEDININNKSGLLDEILQAVPNKACHLPIEPASSKGTENEDAYNDYDYDHDEQHISLSDYEENPLEPFLEVSSVSDDTLKPLSETLDSSTSAPLTKMIQRLSLFDEEPVDNLTSLPFSPNFKDGLFSYFDSLSNKNWAGPSHWKVSRVVHPHQNIAPSSKKNIEDETLTRRLKSSTWVDFCIAPEVDIKSLFAKPVSVNAISLTPESLLSEKNRLCNLLPENLGISFKDFFSLFCKPNVNLPLGKRRTKKLSSDNGRRPDLALSHEELDTLSELPPSSSSHPPIEDEAPFAVPWSYSDTEDDASIPMQLNNSSKLADKSSPDELGFSHPFSQLSIEDPSRITKSGLVMSSSPKFLRVEPISYCKVARRINIHHLKSVMWSSLSSALSFKNKGTSLKMIVSHIDPMSIGGEEKKAELSFSYYFISLLHLASEHNLQLEFSPACSDILIHNQMY